MSFEFTEKQKQAWAQLAKDPTKRETLAEIITEVADVNHLPSTYMSLLLNSRRLSPGDALRKVVRKGIKVHTLVPGSVHMASEITTQDRMNYVLDGASVKVRYNEWELERGDIGTLAEIRREMRAKLTDFYFNKVFTALSSVWTAANTPNNFTDLGTTVTATSIEDAVNH